MRCIHRMPATILHQGAKRNASCARSSTLLTACVPATARSRAPPERPCLRCLLVHVGSSFAQLSTTLLCIALPSFPYLMHAWPQPNMPATRRHPAMYRPRRCQQGFRQHRCDRDAYWAQPLADQLKMETPLAEGIIEVNVGGRVFATSLATLRNAPGMLAACLGSTCNRARLIARAGPSSTGAAPAAAGLRAASAHMACYRRIQPNYERSIAPFSWPH